MTTDQERAKAILPFVQAIAEGKIVEERWTSEPYWRQAPLYNIWMALDLDSFRIRPKPEMVDLGPEDIKSTTRFRANNDQSSTRRNWDSVDNDGIIIPRWGFLTWSGLRLQMRRTDDDGKTWLPCEKARTP